MDTEQLKQNVRDGRIDAERLVFLVLEAEAPEEEHKAEFSFATSAFGQGTHTEPFMWLGEHTGRKWTLMNPGLWFYQYGKDG